MCGFLIYSSTSKLDISDDNEFLSAGKYLAHRGPDGWNWQKTENTLLLHYRLAVQDVSSQANQPFESQCGRYVIVFNGEIFNYKELKEEYLADQNLLTTSDTEVLIELYKVMGSEVLHKLDGMYAGVIIDKFNDSKFYFRDQYGIKPLYYINYGSAVIASSEIKPLLYYLRSKELKVRKDYLDNYIDHSSCDYGRHTLIEEVNQLEAGFYAVDDPNSQIQWFNLGTILEERRNAEFSQEKFENEIVSSIKRRLISDIPIACTLSGGLDSSTIWSVIKQNNLGDVAPFTVDQVSKRFEQRVNEADIVQKYTNGKVRRLYSEDSVDYDTVRESIYHQEFPSWSLSHVMYDDIYRSLKKKGYSVVLEGHGNDELLGGYTVHFSAGVKSLIMQNKLTAAYNVSKLFFASKGKPSNVKASLLFLIFLFRFDNVFLILREMISRKKRLFNKKYNFKKINKSKKITYLQSVLLADFQRYIIPTVLRVFDRSTMRSGVEMRPPFMSTEHVVNCLSLKDEERFEKSGQKSVLRNTKQWALPDAVLNLKTKKGFSSDLSIYAHLINDQQFQLISKPNKMLEINYGVLRNRRERIEHLSWIEYIEICKYINLVIWYDLFINKKFIQNEK